MSTSVKELSIFQNTFSHVEITTPPVHQCINNYTLTTNKKTILQHCIIKHLNNKKTFYYVNKVIMLSGLTFQKTPGFRWSSNNVLSG